MIKYICKLGLRACKCFGLVSSTLSGNVRSIIQESKYVLPYPLSLSLKKILQTSKHLLGSSLSIKRYAILMFEFHSTISFKTLISKHEILPYQTNEAQKHGSDKQTQIVKPINSRARTHTSTWMQQQQGNKAYANTVTLTERLSSVIYS